MKKIFIIGGNGFARECYLMLKSVEGYGTSIFFGGFLGYATKKFGEVDYKTYQQFYKGDVEDYEFGEDDYAVIGSGDVKNRKKIYDELKARGVKFYTIISKDTILSDTIEIGEANIFVNPFYSSVNIKIGNGNLINSETSIGHDVEIGDFNFIAPRVCLLGNVKIGSFNSIGIGSVLLPHSKIGNNNKIAPLSAVYKGCKNNCYMLGNPALKEGVVEDV